MKDQESKREIPFDKEIEHYQTRLNEVFDSYFRRNTDGCEDPLEICVLRDSKRIINRLQEKVEFYKENRDKYQDGVMYLSKQCDELQSENEGLKTKQEHSKLLVQRLKKKILEAKADAYKECIEKIKSELSFGKYITIEQLDNLYKELVGE